MIMGSHTSGETAGSDGTIGTSSEKPTSPKPELPAETPRLDRLVEGDRPTYPPKTNADE